MRNDPSRARPRYSILLGLALLGALGTQGCDSEDEVILFVINQSGSTSEMSVTWSGATTGTFTLPTIFIGTGADGFDYHAKVVLTGPEAGAQISITVTPEGADPVTTICTLHQTAIDEKDAWVRILDPEVESLFHFNEYEITL